MQLKLCNSKCYTIKFKLLNQPGNSYLSQPGNSPKIFMFNFPHLLAKLANVDGNFKQHIQCFCRIDQKT